MKVNTVTFVMQNLHDPWKTIHIRSPKNNEKHDIPDYTIQKIQVPTNFLDTLVSIVHENEEKAQLARIHYRIRKSP